MTTVAQIITDAFRQSNLVAVGTAPTTAEQTEALRYLNRIVKSVFGNEAGDKLTALPVGTNNIERPAGSVGWDGTPIVDWYVPENVRVVFNLDSAVSLYLHPAPSDGARFAVLDPSSNLATYNVTVYGNGYDIEGANSITLNTSSVTTEWFYRADLGNWQKYSTLLVGDTFPFPEEFDDYFITRLALRLNPSYGHALDPQSQEVLQRSKTQLRARYSQNIQSSPDIALVRLSRMGADRDVWIGGWPFDPNTMFTKGWPW